MSTSLRLDEVETALREWVEAILGPGTYSVLLLKDPFSNAEELRRGERVEGAQFCLPEPGWPEGTEWANHVLQEDGGFQNLLKLYGKWFGGEGMKQWQKDYDELVKRGLCKPEIFLGPIPGAFVKFLDRAQKILFVERRRVEEAVYLKLRDLDNAEAEAAERVASTAPNLFHCEGEMWRLRFEGQETTLQDSVGWRRLRRLLQEPGKAIHYADLLNDAPPPSPPGELPDRGRDEDERPRAAEGDRVNAVLDPETIAELQQTAGDERAAALERAAAREELAKSTWRGARKNFGGVEKSNKESVRGSITTVLKKLRERLPALALHLQQNVRYDSGGARYTPSPPIDWTF